jgi:hypothetical protein
MTGSLLCLCFLVHVYVVHEKQKGLLPKKEAHVFHSYFGCVNFGPFYHQKERRKKKPGEMGLSLCKKCSSLLSTALPEGGFLSYHMAWVINKIILCVIYNSSN